MLVLVHGRTHATTEAVRIRAVIRDGGNADGLSDPQGHRRGAANGGKAHGSEHCRAERGGEPLWATSAPERQLATMRVALAGEGIDTLNEAAFARDQFAHGVRA